MATLIRCLGIVLVLLGLSGEAGAQVQASLDRSQLRLGEVANLSIRGGQPGDTPDFAPLERDFLLYAPTLRRQSVLANGQFIVQVEHTIGIEPRHAGELVVPALRVGQHWTQPLLLQVDGVEAGSSAAGSDAPLVFVRTRLDSERPWVHQSVGVVVALYYATALASGELVQEAPDGAGLQRVGEDRSDQAVVAGRHYNVVERRYLLLPERSGPLALPPARFRGRAADGGRGRLLAAQQDPALQVEVQPQPASAPSPWLPLHGLRLAWTQVPQRAAAGQGFELELVAELDGASRAQLDTLPVPAAGPGYRLYPQATEVEERFDSERPLLRLRRRVVVVAAVPGTLQLPGIALDWWNVDSGQAERARLAPLSIAIGPAQPGPPLDPARPAAAAPAAPAAAGEGAGPLRWPWWGTGLLLLAGGALLAAGARRRGRDTLATPAAGAAVAGDAALERVLAEGSLQEIIDALAARAGVDGFAALLAALDDPQQRQALAAAEQAWWGRSGGDRVAARARLRRAFAAGPRCQDPLPAASVDPLPPLYPPPSP